MRSTSRASSSNARRFRAYPRRSHCRLAKTSATRRYAGRGLIESYSPDKRHLTLMPVFILPFPAIDPVAISVGVKAMPAAA
jgi:hypothetical protein